MPSLVVIVLAWAVVAFFAVGLLLKWNAPLTDRSYERPLWFAWGELWWTGYRRIALPAGLMFLSWAISFTLPASIAGWFGLAGALTFGPLCLTVMLFNWPKALVPPACRSQLGIVPLVRRRRSETPE